MAQAQLKQHQTVPIRNGLRQYNRPFLRGHIKKRAEQCSLVQLHFHD